MSNRAPDLRPYLVIPKLIEQPTWGGEYIVDSKGWSEVAELAGRKIGQSYELFSGSNLSLLKDSTDQRFQGELTNNILVSEPSTPPNSVSLKDFASESPEDVFGKDKAKQMGGKMNLLIKFTQALGNSFQTHIKDGVKDEFWKPKPESWYYFEPGFITLGVKENTDWSEYQTAVSTINDKITNLGNQIKAGTLTFGEAQNQIKELVQECNPWRYVNLYYPRKDELIDLSAGGVHHSWEEDPDKFPLGNVLYEVQLEVMDGDSTMRAFDRGKIAPDGLTRQLHIEDYFRFIDRSPEVNDPLRHLCSSEELSKTSGHILERLLVTKYYTLDRVKLSQAGATYIEKITEFRHIFVKVGSVEVSTVGGTVTVGQGHSCFIPAGSKEYEARSTVPASELLLSY